MGGYGIMNIRKLGLAVLLFDTVALSATSSVQAQEAWSVREGSTAVWLTSDNVIAKTTSASAPNEFRKSLGGESFVVDVLPGGVFGIPIGQQPAKNIHGRVSHNEDILLRSASGEAILRAPELRVIQTDTRVRFEMSNSPTEQGRGLILNDTTIMFDRIGKSIVITSGAVTLAPETAKALGLDAGAKIGHLLFRARIARADSLNDTGIDSIEASPSLSQPLASTIGPDVIVGDLYNEGFFGRVGGISAFAVGTRSCNVGDQPADWFSTTERHPVIDQSMFRYANNRFEQIGLSWVKHGFFAVRDESFCGGGCQDPGGPMGTRLGVGCSDPYSASLNGEQANMGPRSQVNPHTGVFPFPYTVSTPAAPTIGRRLQVKDVDIDPALNPGALYFIEGHYVTADDAAAGNGNNNASYRPITIAGPDGLDRFTYNLIGTTQQEQAGIRAWQDHDPAVVETDIQLPGEGLFILAAKETALANGFWEYQYAIQNLNSDRSGASFFVPLPNGSVVTDIGFHDVDQHSGEPFSLTDWSAVVSTNGITWSTDIDTIDPNANALRWGSMYNFRFRANVTPAATTITLGLFKQGAFNDITAPTIGPKLDLIDCNGNTIADACDISCEAVNCTQPCGGSEDCNSNGVPDECERDCNNNVHADECDVAQGISPDCNSNLVPDECEVDCDGDGIPDECDVFDDVDQDAIPDCFDLCPSTLPLGPCVCPPAGLCCFPPNLGGFCVGPIPAADCIDVGGIPDCRASQLCLDGCLLGDTNDNGELELRDFAALQNCYSGSVNTVGFAPLTPECARVFDFDADTGVDGTDYAVFESALGGPCSEDADNDGTPNCRDACPADSAKTVPGVCGCHIPDSDTDGDTVLDCNDLCPLDAMKVEPGQCGCGSPDIDSDLDGVLDCNDLCPSDAAKIEPGQCGCGLVDVDSDGDGSADCVDGCPLDPQKTSPGQCGCQNSDIDTDGDGTADCIDGCESDPEKTTPGQCGCGRADIDSDGDGVLDCFDDCPFDEAKTSSGICGCGIADTDSDGDGTPDCIDGCPFDPTTTLVTQCN